MDAEGGVPEKARKATGGGALIDAISEHVGQGRQADLDAAFVFLSKFGKEIEPEETAQPEPEEKAVEERDEGPSDDALCQALGFVNEKSSELALLAGAKEDASDQVLSVCAETMDHLVEVFSSDDLSNVPLLDEIEEAYEMLVLLQLEQDVGSAADAATVLLQVKRELEFAQAA